MLKILPFIREWRPQLRCALLTLTGAFLLCTPYLFHTWQKTGQILCWSTNSGELLHWMCSANEGENGQWFPYSGAKRHPDLAKNHAVFFENALKKTALEREALFKQAAITNFKTHPMKVGYHCLCNLSRLALGFPRTFEHEELRTIVLIITNGPIILLAITTGLFGIWRWRSIPMEICFLMDFVAFYLGGSSLAPSVPRYFVVVYPMVILGSFTVCKKIFICQLSPKEKD